MQFADLHAVERPPMRGGDLLQRACGLGKRDEHDRLALRRAVAQALYGQHGLARARPAAHEMHLAPWQPAAKDLVEPADACRGLVVVLGLADRRPHHLVPREHWPQTAGTNPLERVNRESKRRADAVGIFPNDDAIVRLVGALMLKTNDERAFARRYMSLETLTPHHQYCQRQAARCG